MPSNPILGWERLQDKFYRNIEGYYLQWQGIAISEYIVASAPHGGAIALTRDDSQLRVYKGPDSRQTSISIYSGAGTLIKKILWDNGRIRGLGWSQYEQLIVVSENGSARCYYDFDGNFSQFSLGKAAELNGVLECKFWDSGFVALLTNNLFVSVSRYDEPNPRLLASSSVQEKSIHSWAIVPPFYQLGQHVEVILSIDNTVIVADTTDVHDKYLEEGPFTHMAVSPNGEFIALFTGAGHLWVISSGFHKKLSDYNTNEKTPPKQLVWCGNDSVAVVYEDEILLVGPQGGTLNLYFDGPVVAVPEIDGIRTITDEKHDFFSLVPDVTVNIFKIGSVSPAAILLDSVDQLERNSPKADENLQIIGNQLTDAVNSCIEAAGYEFEPYWQKALLKAATFGKSALELYDSDKYVEMTEFLRVLNTVRQINVGLLMSHQQLLCLTPNRLIDRLLLRKMHLLAFKCAEYLRLPQDKIYIHWACCKVRSSKEDDESVCREIVNRLGSHAGISYEEIAQTAYEEGRHKLAIMLTHYEPRPSKQVPLLLNMGEEELALDKAIDSLNINLIVFVLLQLQQKLPIASFFRFINDKPLASRVFEYICKAQDPKLLRDFYYQDDRRYDCAMLLFNQSFKEHDTDEQLEKLKEAEKTFLEFKERTFEAKTTVEEMKLIKLQLQLENDYDQPFVGKTVTETISQLVSISQNSRANKVKDEFKVPEKRFWWIKAKALVARRDWDDLLKFAKSKKSPIGYEPFFNLVFKAGNKRHAALYVPLCTNLSYKERIKLFVQVDAIRQAAQEAVKAKDLDELQNLEPLATSTVKSEIHEYIAQLKAKK
ncbi:uncharacterized protein SAPINGB_P005238 [Magnusiomyces paraingens]|uniref:Probable vacuolar protein sorting-associated protein 16 homolog n=1 Tax=Magnusiomyces paraingens TaxID=2606893 RepID=A0A5E8C038_9ASCO|nr:uncharacterized protein SAPINGB_P005238 [Saprochaete ingens]VVT56732.1 unnamed protein product [Saprochaete ingens]